MCVVVAAAAVARVGARGCGEATDAVPALGHQLPAALEREGRRPRDAESIQLHERSEQVLQKVEQILAVPGAPDERLELRPERVVEQASGPRVAPAPVAALRRRAQLGAECLGVRREDGLELGLDDGTHRVHLPPPAGRFF